MPCPVGIQDQQLHTDAPDDHLRSPSEAADPKVQER